MGHYLVTLLVALHLLAPISTYAAGGREITSYTLKQWLFVLAMALLGGFVNWWGQVRRGELKATSVSSLVGELCTSAFAGLLAFFICEWADFPDMLTAAMTGIAGHMGTRGIAMFETWAARKFDATLPRE
jgi:hypothetical protein